MRRGRARDGMLLLEYLQDGRIRTYFLGAELERQLKLLVPPWSSAFPTLFARVFAHHLQPLLFPRWMTITDSGDAGKTGSDCDRHLVHVAKALGVPLITSETRAKGAIRRAARKAGVRVLTPRQFWSPRAHERALIRALLSRWRRNKRKLWRRARGMFVNNRVAADVLGTIGGYLRHILLGEMATPAAPATPAAA